MKQEISICWLRRDLRLTDNTALFHSLKSGYPVLIVFIFDTDILDQLPSKNDKRVAFIHECLNEINDLLQQHGSSLLVLHHTPLDAFKKIFESYRVKAIFTNHDYEPYAIRRDESIKELAAQHQITFQSFKDQVIFEKGEVMKPDGEPYTVFTPYSKIWKNKFRNQIAVSLPSEKHLSRLLKMPAINIPSLTKIGFEEIKSDVAYPVLDDTLIQNYEATRNFPSIDGTTQLGIYLRFGTISIRHLATLTHQHSEAFLNELIWREFFMMILFNFPYVATHPFKQKFENIQWRNNEKEFGFWCKGQTGYPMVDASMRQLNETGWMHNRVRMVVAGFLAKHLLIDYRWGEAYFAGRLLDYELASNNGNWQWAAGTGCDAAPYFRIFNPDIQIKKFDPELIYIKKWIAGFRPGYIEPIVEHAFARKRALEVFKQSLAEN